MIRLVLVLAIACLPGASLGQDESTACALYEDSAHGEMIEDDLQVYADWQDYTDIPIRYRADYREWSAPPCVSGKPCTAALFNIDIRSGRPPDRRDQEYWRNVHDYDHVAVFLDTHAWSPVVELLPTYAGRPVDAPAEDFEFTGEMLAGHHLVIYPDDTDPLALMMRQREQLGVRLNADGEVASILICRREEAYHNPTCTHVQHIDLFGPATLRARIDREQLESLDLAVQRAIEFTSCLRSEP